MADVVQFPNAAPRVQEIIADCVAANPGVTDCIVIMFNADDEGAMNIRRYCTKMQLAMAGARLVHLAGSDHEDADYDE